MSMKIGLYIKQKYILLIAHSVIMAMAFIMALVKIKHGPFATLDEAIKAAKATGEPVSKCEKCEPK